MKFYANPYSWDLTGFYFDSMEEYKYKLEAAQKVDPSGDFEHSVEDIDLEEGEQLLFNSVGSNVSKFFELYEEFEDEFEHPQRLETMKWLVDNGYANDIEHAKEKFEDVETTEDLQEYAFDCAVGNGLEEDSFAYRYFDWESFINDAQCNGEIVTLRESCQFGDLYIVNANSL